MRSVWEVYKFDNWDFNPQELYATRKAAWAEAKRQNIADGLMDKEGAWLTTDFYHNHPVEVRERIVRYA